MELKYFFVKVFFKTNNIFFLSLLLFLSCQRTLNWDITARGSLKDAQGLCYAAEVHGTFSKGIIPGADTSYVELKVNVYSPGNYLISTDLQNGLKFSDAGAFAETGIHLIKLKPAGKAFISAPTNFKVAFDTSICSFSINVRDTATGQDFLNTWRYTNTETNHLYQGIINATYLVSTPSTNLVSLRHEIANPSDTSFDITVEFASSIVPGSFTTDVINNFALSSKGVCINCAWNVAFQLYGALTNIIVTSYDPQTRIIKGTFSGTTIDGDNNILPVKNGAFSAVIK